MWGSKRSETVYESLQSSSTLMVWSVTSKTEIIDLFFLEDETVTGERYKKVLRYYLFPKLTNYPSDMSFQQNRALPHYANIEKH